MACNCENYACLETVINLDPCRSSIELKLPANETGSWIYSYEFNDKWFGGSIDVVNGENIVLPFTFNEHYIHQIKFYNSQAELFNDTCYSLNTSKIVGAYTNNTTMPEENVFNIIVAADGNTFSSSKINGRAVMLVFDGTQAYNRQSMNFTQTGNTITMTDISFYQGQIITVTVAH